MASNFTAFSIEKDEVFVYAYYISSGIAFSSKIKRPGSQTREHFDQVLQETNLNILVNYIRRKKVCRVTHKVCSHLVFVGRLGRKHIVI